MKKVLVIDDNDLHLQLISHILRKEGFDSITFKSGMEAISWLKSNPVDLILVDIMIPIMNGLEFLRALRAEEKLKNIKCIALTAQQRFQNQTFEELGFDGFIAKPIIPKSFVNYIKNFN